MCGNANSCSVPKGVSPQRAGVLTRREAYQLALLTFKYVPTVERRRPDAAARQGHEGARDLHPPRHGAARTGSAGAVRCPAAQTKINLVSQREAEVIAKTTDPFVYSWILATVDSQPTLVSTRSRSTSRSRSTAVDRVAAAARRACSS